MDIKQLEYFVHVAELGSFTKASVVLDIAQPALSRQIRQLEVELRQSLLNRNGRGVTTTEAGKLLLEHGRGILHQMARAMEDLGRVRGALAGRVAVGIPPSVSRLMTLPLTREFHKRLPNASLSISEGLSFSMQEWLLEGRLDIALLYNPTFIGNLEAMPLIEEDLFFVSLRKNDEETQPITLMEVAKLPLIVPNRPNAIRILIESQMATIGSKPQIKFEIDSIPAILDLIAHGAGHAILPRYAVSTSQNPGAYLIRPIVQPKLISRLYVATASKRTTTLTQNAALAIIKEIGGLVFPESA